MIPPGVRAPYERADGGAVRQVKSQRERDTEAIALAQRKGVMLAQLAQLAADDRLDPASVPIVEWFREQVKDARGGGRLDELAERLRECLSEGSIRRRRFWQGRPAAIEAGYDDDQDGDDQDDDGSLAVTGYAPASAVDYAAEMDARNWGFKPHGAGVCHVVARGWGDGSPDPCARRADHVIAGGAVCDHHHQALTTPLNRRPA